MRNSFGEEKVEKISDFCMTKNMVNSLFAVMVTVLQFFTLVFHKSQVKYLRKASTKKNKRGNHFLLLFYTFLS